MSLSPWPQQVFLNWHLTDTTPAKGCLCATPGSDRRRLDLHDSLVPPHESGGYEVEETNEWMFYDHPEAVDVPVTAGQLLVGDARLLRGTRPNASDERRTVLLGWFYRKSNSVPEGWQGDVPPEILARAPTSRSAETGSQARCCADQAYVFRTSRSGAHRLTGVDGQLHMTYFVLTHHAWQSIWRSPNH